MPQWWETLWQSLLSSGLTTLPSHRRLRHLVVEESFLQILSPFHKFSFVRMKIQLMRESKTNLAEAHTTRECFIPLIFIIETDLLFAIRTWTSGGRVRRNTEPRLKSLKNPISFLRLHEWNGKAVWELLFFLYQILFLLFSFVSILNNIFILGFSHFICNAHWMLEGFSGRESTRGRRRGRTMIAFKYEMLIELHIKVYLCNESTDSHWQILSVVSWSNWNFLEWKRLNEFLSLYLDEALVCLTNASFVGNLYANLFFPLAKLNSRSLKYFHRVMHENFIACAYESRRRSGIRWRIR